MSRTKRSAALDSPTKRKSLGSGDYHQEPIGSGAYLRYRRPGADKLGSWFVRDPDPVTGKLSQAKIADADDDRPADGYRVMDYTQARKAAEVRVETRTKSRRAAASGETTPNKLRTVKEVMGHYLQVTGKDKKSDKLRDDAKQAVEANILPELGEINVTDLTTARINKWHEALAARGRRKTGWVRKPGEEVTFLPLVPLKKAKDMKPGELKIATELAIKRRKSSANRDLAMLKAALNLAYTQGRLVSTEHVPWIAVKAFSKVKGQRLRVLSIEESQRLVNACDPEFRRLVQGALYTGARYSELTGTKVEDFNQENGSLMVWGKGRGEVSRHIYLTDEATAFFSELVAGRPGSELLFMRSGVERKTRVDDPNASGWLSADTDTPMRLAINAAKIEKLTFHELRHTYASALIARGVPLLVVAQQLGHRDTRMVEEHYGHLAPNATKDTIRALAPTLGISCPSQVQNLEIKKA